MNEYEKMNGEKSAGEIAALKARIQDLMNELKLKDQNIKELTDKIKKLKKELKALRAELKRFDPESLERERAL